MQMKQLNATKCSAEKNRFTSLRPVSPSSIRSGYSLYSTDTDDQVMSTHRGLDRCAALLANMMESEGIENVPTKLERGVRSKLGGMSHTNQQNKQTTKQKVPVTKTRVKTTSIQKKPVRSGSLKEKKQTGRRSFNQKLVSSTPNQKHTKLNKAEQKKQGSDRMHSKDTHRDRTDVYTEKEVTDKAHPRIPARVSPGNKENFPLSKQPSQRGNGPKQFIETYDVTPQVLNDNVITKTRVRTEVVKNPAIRHEVARVNEKPQRNAASSRQGSTVQSRLNEEQTYVERDYVMLQPQHVGITRQEQQWTELPQEVNGQTGHITGTVNYTDPNTQPWVSRIDMDPVRITPDHLRSAGTQNIHHLQQHDHDHYKQHQDQLDPHAPHPQGHAVESQLAAATWKNSRTAPGLQSSRNLDSHLESGVRQGLVSDGMGPVQTTQSILRDLVGKLQKMNESQIQTPQTQLSHPSPGSGVTQNNISHTHQQMGHGSKNVSRRGVDHNVREQDERMQDMLSLDRNFAKHSTVHHASRSGSHGISLRARAVGTHNADPQSRAEQLEPVRDSGRSCDHKSTNQSPGSLVTQMQRVSHEVAKDPIDAVIDTGTPKPHTSPKGHQVKDDVGVQTPPFSSRPPVVMTGTKGSNALWDQVRTLKYITKELHSANMKIGDVQTQELLTELEEVVETLPFTSLDRDLQTEISLALQPIRSENSQLRRRLRIANQQLRQIQLQAQAKENSQSGVSLEVLTLQSLNVNLQKQVEELQSETDRQTRDMTELRASLDALNVDKHNMQDIFMKMDNDLKEKRKSWTLETSTLRQEMTKLKSQLESEGLRTESIEKEKEILILSVKQRDSEIKRLQQMTRNMQGILLSVVPEKSLKSSLPGESKESRLENWLENHQSAISTPRSINRNDTTDTLHQTAWRQGQRSPHDSISSSSSSSRGGHYIKLSSPDALHRDDWRKIVSDQRGCLDDHHVISGGGERHKSSQIEATFGADGRCEDLDSTLVEDTLDGDGTAYMSFADPQLGSRKPWIFQASHRPLPGGGTPSWVEKELSPATKSGRKHTGCDKTGPVSDSLGRTGNENDRRSPPPYKGRIDSRLRKSEEEARDSERDLGRIFNAAEVGSVVSESTISSIASQYEAQFQVGLSKLDDDIARLQQNLKGLVQR
ncbi:uncharacterized protein LOC105446194 [Strongylocentrotus purpuratus]|uniref:Coiled-coil domain-containing protein 14 n=1 Tax=Strongylocentrotus purpuratus TaxID=7668 RepID=A0A7M7HPZ3_STRPU|nr:uncharacterized protein LOC105446194 [Strongylocentrotus purpuratus]